MKKHLAQEKSFPVQVASFNLYNKNADSMSTQSKEVTNDSFVNKKGEHLKTSEVKTEEFGAAIGFYDNISFESDARKFSSF